MKNNHPMKNAENEESGALGLGSGKPDRTERKIKIKNKEKEVGVGVRGGGGRVGKIARLPRGVREELNVRMEDGVAARVLVAWLNKLPVVREVLAEQFEGRAITEVNLSAWRQGGFAEWGRMQRAREAAGLMRDELQAWENDGDAVSADLLAGLAAVALGQLLQEAMQMEAGPEKERAVVRIAREIARMRDSDRREERATREEENYIREVADESKRRKREAITAHRQHWAFVDSMFKDARKLAARCEKRGKPVPEEARVLVATEAAGRAAEKEVRRELEARPAGEFDPVVISRQATGDGGQETDDGGQEAEDRKEGTEDWDGVAHGTHG